MTSVKTKYYDFKEFISGRDGLGDKQQIPHLYYKLYEKTKLKKNPVILELGTHRGISTLVFLQATLENGGSVYSVDIDDQYSDLTDSENWTFVHSDSTNIEGILAKHPELRDGIDILLIDSLHKKSHVEREFWGWEPYLNEGAYVVFDDIDSHIYRPGARKDHLFHEFDWEEIREFVEETFYANEDALFLEIHLGSTGFAIMSKRTDKSTRLKKGQTAKRRTTSVFWKSYMHIIKTVRALKS